ncbi:MAG: response regulator [Burkholderiales bacterium]|jgi:CheY-like chemotaxis protein|nr:response regulator [Burkholderiales bacterium]
MSALHNVDIVVVDDDAEAAQTLAELLQTDGYAVRSASSGAEALQLIMERRPLGVLLDVDMPAINGYQLARRLREHFAGDLVLIAFTGLGDEAALVQQTLPLVDDFLRKPVDPKQLRKIFPQLGGSSPT